MVLMQDAPRQGRSISPPHLSLARSLWCSPHLLIPLQRGHKGPLVKEHLQPVLSVVAAELLKGCSPLLPLVSRVAEAGGVQHHDGSHGEVVGGEGPEGAQAELADPGSWENADGNH